MTTQEPGNTQANDGEISCADDKPFLSFKLRRAIFSIILVIIILSLVVVLKPYRILDASSFSELIMYIGSFLFIGIMSYAFYTVFKNGNICYMLYEHGLHGKAIIVDMVHFVTKTNVTYEYKTDRGTFSDTMSLHDNILKIDDQKWAEKQEISILYDKNNHAISIIEIPYLRERYK